MSDKEETVPLSQYKALVEAAKVCLDDTSAGPEYDTPGEAQLRALLSAASPATTESEDK